MVYTIVRDDLGKRKICSRFVPHKLTDKQKAKRTETSGGFISICDQDRLLLENIVMGDETWCCQFDLESKWQSMVWCSPTFLRPKKSHLQNSKVKTLLIIFFDNKGIIHKEFVPASQTINAAFYHVWPVTIFSRSIGSWSHMEMKSVEVTIHFAFCLSVSLCGTNREQIFRLPKSSWTMMFSLSLLMPNSSTINLSISRRSCASFAALSWSFLGFCLSVADPKVAHP